MTLFDWLWILLIANLLLIPYLQRYFLILSRLNLIRLIENQQQARVITMIHRQEMLRFLGLPLTRFLDIEDAEQVLQAIHETPSDKPIDFILHTPGGLALPAEQIAFALSRHQGKVRVFVPHYAMSGGTLIALAADEIIMDTNAVLGSVDPQLGNPRIGYYPAVSVLKALKQPNPNRDDQILILGDVAEKAIKQIRSALVHILQKHTPKAKAERIAQTMSEGRWTHDHPIPSEELKAIGLPVENEIPPEIYQLMQLYPQPSQRWPSVEYLPPSPEPSPPKRPKK